MEDNWMTRQRWLSLILVGLISGWLGLPSLGAANSPTDSVVSPQPLDSLTKMFETINTLKQNLSKNKEGKLDASAKAEDEKMREWVIAALDYEELSKRSLAAHWDEIKVSDRQQFVALLRELVKRTSLKKLESYSEHKMTYQKAQIKGNEAFLKSSVTTDDVDVHIDYWLHLIGPRWVIFDMIIDDVSLIQGYKTQFHKIITEAGYPKLIEKMNKRLETLKGEETQADALDEPKNATPGASVAVPPNTSPVPASAAPDASNASPSTTRP
jgi:phospholipid transport system substrate-binding protein